VARPNTSNMSIVEKAGVQLLSEWIRQSIVSEYTRHCTDRPNDTGAMDLTITLAILSAAIRSLARVYQPLTSATVI